MEITHFARSGKIQPKEDSKQGWIFTRNTQCQRRQPMNRERERERENREEQREDTEEKESVSKEGKYIRTIIIDLDVEENTKIKSVEGRKKE